MRIKIALSGKLGTGKSTFFDVAQRFFPNLHFQEGKFASILYKMQDLLQKELGIESHKDGRLLQFLGTHFKEETNNTNLWVEKYFKGVDPEVNDIITDCRFPNEVTQCQERGYFLVKIERRIELRGDSIGNRDPNHISETVLDSLSRTEFDYIINNNGSMDMFEEAVINTILDMERKQHDKERKRQVYYSF